MTAGRKIKVRVVTTLEVDVDAWCAEYGDDPSEVRERVRSYFDPANYLPEHLQDTVRVL